MAFQEPPDGGWGWVIVVASFFAQFLASGSPKAVGVLYLKWLDIFQQGKGKTAWVGSLANGVGLILSPICSLCVSSFGAKAITIISGFMVCGGLIISAYAPDLYFLFFSYGTIVGFGIGLIHTATVTIVCQYFDKRRGLALGLVSTGCSIGLFIYPKLQKELIEMYGLDGCLLIVGALALNVFPCGCLMRSLGSSDCPSPEKIPVERVSATYSIHIEEEKTLEENVIILEKGYSEENFVRTLTSSDSKLESPFHENEKQSATGQTKETEVYKKKFEELKNLCKQLAKKKWEACQNYCRETVSLFKNKIFSALFLAIFLRGIGGFPPLLLMEDVAINAGVKEEECPMPLISIIGIMTGIGKFLLGILADFKFINTVYLCTATLILTSVTLFAIPFAKTYVSLAILSGMLGFLTGNWSIFPYVTTKTVGIEKLTHAYGILMFFAGVGNVVGPPIVGSFFDWTHSYDIAFYFCGFCVLFGGVVLLLVAIPMGNICHRESTKPAPNSSVYQTASQV